MLEKGATNVRGASPTANPERAELGQPAQQRTAWYWKITNRKDGQSEREYVVRLKRAAGFYALYFLFFALAELIQVSLLWVNMLSELAPFQYANASPFLILSRGLKDDMNKLALFLVLGFGRALVLKASTGILLTSGVCCLKPLPLLLAATLITVELCHDGVAFLFWTFYVVPFKPVAFGWEHAVRAVTALFLVLYPLNKFFTVCFTLAFRELLMTGEVMMALENYDEVGYDVDGNQVAPAACCFNVEDEKDEEPAVAAEAVETKPVVPKAQKSKGPSRVSKRVRKSTIKVV